MSCNKGGFINTRYNDVRDLTAKILSNLCHDMQIEPTLLPLSREWMEQRRCIDFNEVRLDI